MSNSIWHKYDIKDIPNPHHEILAWTGTKHAVVIIKQAEWRSGDCDWIESWAYIQDVLAQADKAERLQKAVDYALHYLDAEYCAYIMVHQKEPELIAKVLEEIKQLIKEN